MLERSCPHFNIKDELFIRKADGMRPTSRALELAAPVRQALTFDICAEISGSVADGVLGTPFYQSRPLY
ncbi:MAG: hypothetical protein V7L29_06165 [Nostoc sp.]|uniref:hypothetical protein n=1 Tax=Nostoc sp. TaxID=1180 RepID=UPI002FF42635